MAKPRTKPQEPPPDPDNLIQTDDEFDPEDIELAEAASELTGIEGATVTIYRQGLHGRDLTFIDTLPPANFAMAMLKHPPYNGGKFRVMMRKGSAIVANRLVQVEPAPKAPDAPPVYQPPVVQQQSNEAFVLLAKAMTDGFSRIGELIVATKPEPAKQRSTQEILAELAAMKSLFAQPQAEHSDPIEMLTKLLALTRELPGGGDGGEPGPMAVLLELARTFGPQLKEIKEQNDAARAPSDRETPPRVVGPVPRPTRPVGTQPQGRPNVEQLIGMQLRFLVKQASQRRDPEPYAVMVLDNVPPPILDNFLKRPDWFEEVVRYAPDARPYAEWFGRLKSHLEEYLTEEPEPEHTSVDLQTQEGASVDAAPSGDREPAS